MSLWRNTRVSGGFCLLAAWFALANGWPLLVMVLGAAAIHEGGHWLAIQSRGARVTALRLTIFGAEMETTWNRLSYGAELTAVLAGPAANLLCGAFLAALGEPWFTAAGAHLVLGIFNLLPIRPLDGGRALEAAVSWAAGPTAGDWAARWVGATAAMALAAALLRLLWYSGGSLWLLPAAAGMLWVAFWEFLPANRRKK